MSPKPFLVINGVALYPQRPRQYAAAILQLEDLEERRAAYARTPPEWKKLIFAHLQIAWNHPQRQHPTG
ncbi:hypothetical protein [Pseudomonas delhiensis]|uniref:hypothetical protein n=1 Tax=Pseudomonas delhiensis TaxID=366289 RepID=UPI003159AAFD